MNDKIKIYNRMNYPSPNLPIIPQTKNPINAGKSKQQADCVVL